MTTMEHFKMYCDIAISKPIIKRAMKVSLIVGTTLNLINQGEYILALELENVNLLKLLLTYFVPYGVTTYTAIIMKLDFYTAKKAIIAEDLLCTGCGAEIHVEKDELIPECHTCGIKTHWKIK